MDTHFSLIWYTLTGQLFCDALLTTTFFFPAADPDQ